MMGEARGDGLVDDERLWVPTGEEVKEVGESSKTLRTACLDASRGGEEVEEVEEEEEEGDDEDDDEGEVCGDITEKLERRGCEEG